MRTTRTDIDWTPRQREVLALLARGKTNPEIARELGLTLDGAKWHVSEVMSKLGVSKREEAAAYWRREMSPLARIRRGAGVFGLVGVGRAAMAGVVLLAAGGIAAAVVFAGRDGEVPAQEDATPIATLAPATTAIASTTIPPTATVAPPPEAGGTIPTLSGFERKGLHPPGTQTGDARFDRIIALVEAKDVDGLVDLVAWEGYPCWESARPSGITLRCPDGVSEGTLIPAFPIGSVEGGPVADEAAVRSWVTRMVESSDQLYGVSWRTAAPERAAITFARSSIDNSAAEYGLTEDGQLAGGHLVTVSFWIYDYTLQQGGFHFEPLPINFEPSLGVHAPGTRIGDPDVDALIDTVEGLDIAALYDSLAWQTRTCSLTEPPAPGTTLCAKLGIQGPGYPAFPEISGTSEYWISSRIQMIDTLVSAVMQSPFLVGVYRTVEDGGELRHIHFGVDASGEAAGATFTIDGDGRLVRLTWNDPLYPLAQAKVDWMLPPP